MINYVNDNRPDHIITIEDPIEFVHESKRCLINQREVHRDTLGFSEALRSALREDPDVILVGEMRDLETIRLALTGAETGHLVFGTLHTSSAAKTIDRVVDVFPAAEKEMVRAMLSESLRAVISQSLLKRIGGGRIAAHEIMIGTPAIRNLIREGKIAQMYSAIQTGQQAGMQTLDQCLKETAAERHDHEGRGPLPRPEQGGLSEGGAGTGCPRGRHPRRTEEAPWIAILVSSSCRTSCAAWSSARGRTSSSPRAFLPRSRSTARSRRRPTSRSRPSTARCWSARS
jgi:hypothetical protein